jgi:ADP-ribosylglycohydrolase
MMRDQIALATRLVGGVWGHLIGDAVGVPYEFRTAAAVRPVRWGEQGTHGQPPGTWSDDGALMLALLDALLVDHPGERETSVTSRFDTEEQGRRIVAWRREKAYTPDGDGVFDIGNATGAAIRALETGTPAEKAGGTDEYSNGNGSLMRILPIALVFHDLDDADLVDRAHRASQVTHGTARAQVACSLYVFVATRLVNGASPRDAMEQARRSLRSVYADDLERLAALDHLEGYTDRGGLGRVWDSFWSAWDAFEGATSYQETIERAIAYGNDTDTTAAIAGGLAGIHWGIDGIPPEWLDGMRGREVADPLVDRLLALHGWRTSTTNPMRVNWVSMDTVPRFRDLPGRLGMTFLPGKQRDGWSGRHWRTLGTDLRQLREHGADVLFLLVEDVDLEMARVVDIEGACAGAGIELVRHAVVDMDIPSDGERYRVDLDRLIEDLRAGRDVAVACRGGLGRTGTAVACLLVDGGLDPDDAITLTRASRKHTIERHGQEQFVREWIWPVREGLA